MTLSQFFEPNPHDIQYPNIAVDVQLDVKGKPVQSWMKDWTQEERTEKFFEFCRAYDEREDTLLKQNYQQFSHRLHWHECPFVDEVSKENDPQWVLNACILFSFTNEHWQTYRAWADLGNPGMRDRFNAGHRHARSDLFQIYYPKGTHVDEWLLAGPQKAAIDLAPKLFTTNRRYSMMEFAKKLNEYFVEEQGFRNAMYPCKNAARHVAMSHPEWVDPDSFLHGGTGYFDGLNQVFDCGNLMGKSKYIIDEFGEYVPLNKHAEKQVELMNYLKNHPSNPIHTHQYLNLEDKLCMHFKFMAVKFGTKNQTKQIPYDWVYPNEWSLKINKYDRLLNAA
jgi:hypothetical protein